MFGEVLGFIGFKIQNGNGGNVNMMPFSTIPGTGNLFSLPKIFKGYILFKEKINCFKKIITCKNFKCIYFPF